ncbi:hypothetical protein F0U44_16420 [Nocardioides humilatus]|uniref:Uncharacterized protein n=1 Tax=Nocardioides humilatus TaxID=2607660 RepID=A0A5B1LAG8_9ACTN|nr:hypothetical protein [Nocardioides humilatus]KAA1416780.1 hypothetical protein F0U44_16420 [Nocardioides humilatus]
MAAFALRRRSPWLIGATIVVALVVVLGLRSCQGQVIEVDGVTVLVGEYDGGASDIRAGGVLEVVGGCLGAEGRVYVFPHGTEVVDEDPLTIDIPEWGEVAVGEEFHVAMGSAEGREADGASPGSFEIAGVDVPADCAAYDVFVAG